MMIRVSQNTIDYDAVIEHYNNNKAEHDSPLQKLDRAEGGFKLDIPLDKLEQHQGFLDNNMKIKQLRWENNCLVSRMGMPRFNANELWDLFWALKMTMGDENVEFVG